MIVYFLNRSFYRCCFLFPKFYFALKNPQSFFYLFSVVYQLQDKFLLLFDQLYVLEVGMFSIIFGDLMKRRKGKFGYVPCYVDLPSDNKVAKDMSLSTLSMHSSNTRSSWQVSTEGLVVFHYMSCLDSIILCLEFLFLANVMASLYNCVFYQ